MSKKEVKKIQDYNAVYSFLRYYVDFSLHQAYSKIEYKGMEKIPKDGAIIFAPNHTNALMDALVILALDHRQKVFVARADIFKNPKIKKILTFLKIMPIMRVRDGLNEVRKNDVIIERSVDVLKDNVPFCILPEGRHRAQHSLLPLSKGIFRIALQAQDILQKENLPLYIVPVGLEYGNFFRFRSTIFVQIGDPINVAEYIGGHEDLTQPELLNSMKEDLTERMKDVILYIPDDDKYDFTFEICAAVINEQVTRYLKDNPKEKRHSLQTRYIANRTTVSQITDARENKPEAMEEIFKKAEEARNLRLSKKISLGSVIMKNPFWSRLIKFILLIITLPYTIPTGILTLPVTGLSAFLFSKMKDRAFYNSIRFVVTLVLWPVLLIIYAIIAYCTMPWLWALIITLVLVPGTILSQDAYKLLRLVISDIKLMNNGKLRRIYKEIRQLYYDKI